MQSIALTAALAAMPWPALAQGGGHPDPTAVGAALSAYGRAAADLRGEQAAEARARETLERRPAAGACHAAAAQTARVGAAWEVLLRQAESLLQLVAGDDERERQAQAAVHQASDGARAASERAVALVAQCRALPASPPASAMPAVPAPLCRGRDAPMVDAELLLAERRDVGAVLAPGGGLVAARWAAGLAGSDLPEILLVRVFGSPGLERTAAASVYPGARPHPLDGLVVGGGRLLAVVVLPAEGAFGDQPVLRDIVRVFLPRFGGGCHPEGPEAWLRTGIGGQTGLGRRWGPDASGAFRPTSDLETGGPSGTVAFRALGAIPYSDLELARLPLGRPVPVGREVWYVAENAGKRAATAGREGACRLPWPAEVNPFRPLSIGVLLVSDAEIPADERLRQRRELTEFAADGPDARPDRLNFFEATGGLAGLHVHTWAADPGRACASGAPDLP